MAVAAPTSGKGFADSRYRDLIAALVSARKAEGLSQEALAARLERHQQFVSRYEIGERRLDAVEFTDIARALGLDPATLIVGIPARETTSLVPINPNDRV